MAKVSCALVKPSNFQHSSFQFRKDCVAPMTYRLKVIISQFNHRQLLISLLLNLLNCCISGHAMLLLIFSPTTRVCISFLRFVNIFLGTCYVHCCDIDLKTMFSGQYNCDRPLIGQTWILLQLGDLDQICTFSFESPFKSQNSLDLQSCSLLLNSMIAISCK